MSRRFAAAAQRSGGVGSASCAALRLFPMYFWGSALGCPRACAVVWQSLTRGGGEGCCTSCSGGGGDCVHMQKVHDLCSFPSEPIVPHHFCLRLQRITVCNTQPPSYGSAVQLRSPVYMPPCISPLYPHHCFPVQCVGIFLDTSTPPCPQLPFRIGVCDPHHASTAMQCFHPWKSCLFCFRWQSSLRETRHALILS